MIHNFAKVIWPLVIASIMATLLKLLIDGSNRRLKLSPGISVALLYLLILLTTGLLSVFLLPKLIQEPIDFVSNPPEIVNSLWNAFKDRYPNVIAKLTTFWGDENLSDFLSDNLKI